jgi:hypothetical protein
VFGTVKGDKKKGKGGSGKHKAERSSDQCPPKQPNFDMANIQNMLFVVRVCGDATSGSLFRSFQGVEEYSHHLK